MILHLAILVQYRRVTDRQTDRHTTTARSSIASRGKNRCTFAKVMIKTWFFWLTVYM